jgi:hypothetical protein
MSASGEAKMELPDAIARSIRELWNKRGRRPLLIHVDAPLVLSGIAWETMVAAAIAKSLPAGTQLGDLHISRSSAALPDIPAPVSRRMRVRVAASSAWFRSALQTWRGMAELVPETADDVVDHSTVVHAIGRPLSSQSTGDWLRVPGHPRGVLGVEQLTTGASTALVVLQAESYEFDQRTATDRDESARMRRLAAAVFASGTWAVFVVPSLPPELARAVVSSIAGVMEEHHRAPHRLAARLVHPILGAVPLAIQLRQVQAEVQRQVREWTGWPDDVDPDLQSELAADVCLFIRDVRPAN